jgi:hypothetical protein
MSNLALGSATIKFPNLGDDGGDTFLRNVCSYNSHMA